MTKPELIPELSAASIAEQLAGKGTKDDWDKLPYHLFPFDALDEVAIILAFGAKKYGERNWENGMNWGRVFRACMGHMWAWFLRKGLDAETGRSHLAHAACCILFLLAWELRGTKTDDRPFIAKKTEA